MNYPIEGAHILVTGGAERNPDGTFRRLHSLWDGSDWDDGYTDNRGRFMVYRPDFPGYKRSDYAFRYHVVWWMAHGEVHPKGMVIHHNDGGKTNDVLSNLKLLSHGEHTRLHHKKNGVQIICDGCGEPFYAPEWRMRSRKTRFCSQDCYHRTPRSGQHRQSIGRGLTLAYQEGRR